MLADKKSINKAHAFVRFLVFLGLIKTIDIKNNRVRIFTFSMNFNL